MQDKSASPPKSPGAKCPVCRAPAVHEHRPFCSRRCADVDLARWLSGSYAIAGQIEDDEDERRTGLDGAAPVKPQQDDG